MNKEELIEVLRQFDEKRVEELPEKTRNIFYAIMKIADERDKLKNIIEELEKWIEEHKQYQLISERYIVWEDKLVNKLKELGWK